MTIDSFCATLQDAAPAANLPPPLQALWWDAHGDWATAHALVDELETQQGMAVHAYLHRKDGEQWNADYWYQLAGRSCYRVDLREEWSALVTLLLKDIRKARSASPN